jgi:uncharacterized protein (DUF697 family)/tellurite resistance protein
MNEQETNGVIQVCLMAAFADGHKDDREREEIRQVAESLGGGAVSMAALYRNVLTGKVSLAGAAGPLRGGPSAQLAYEMAVCVCDADGAANERERTFLAELRTHLGLDERQAVEFERQAEQVVAAPVPGPTAPPPNAVTVAATDGSAAGPDVTAEVQGMVTRYAITAGALELLPQSLASLAILPLQMKMVYRIGARYGYRLDAGHVKELVAALGLGMTGQMVDSIARKFLGKLTKRMAGGLVGGVAGTAGGAAVSFGVTWALGQLAQRYYAAGRTMDMAALKASFDTLVGEGRRRYDEYAGQVKTRAGQITPAQLVGQQLEP